MKDSPQEATSQGEVSLYRERQMILAKRELAILIGLPCIPFEDRWKSNTWIDPCSGLLNFAL